ncbi:hypothetical protein [Actinotalea caeni]|uniref:hypothetical protein n=1 Tax=Actinotalea caeni TaxID=1348467 RepID=UPI0012E2A3CB|nr:hypothetical protein [Actinotalea caeni]
MSTITTQTMPSWPVHTMPEPTGRAASAEIPSWRGVLVAVGGGQGGGKRKAARYERFTTRVVVVSSVLMLSFTASLHVFNYGLETQTSSTSGTHSGFSNTGGSGETETDDE